MDEHGILVRQLEALSQFSSEAASKENPASHRTISDGDSLRKDTTDFPTACRALLLKVLTTADLLDGSVVDDSIKLRSDVHILDVGFGCGDQTSSLVRLAREVKFQYVGVTLNRVQWQFAQNRLTTSKQCDAHDVKIFCADAAKPESWDVGLSTAAQAMAAQRKTDMDGKETGKIPAVWVLALDTLYHFSPSRAPIFTLAARELGASFMAFDIIRSDSATFLQIMLLKLAALVSGCPSNAFVTEKEYRDMLGQAGYDADGVEILDITPHVFQPLARFMKRRETDLGAIGLKMGALKAAGGLFGWWARTGVVKGVVVIARRD